MHKLTFWGVRGSVPTPNKRFMKFGGNTSCVQIETAKGEQLIFDMGTGIVNLGNHLAKNRTDGLSLNIFLSHAHWDHIQGLAFFNLLSNPKCKITIHSRTVNGESPREIISHYLKPPYWPVTLDDIAAEIHFKEIQQGLTFKHNGMKIESLLHQHPNGALGFRISLGEKVIVYMTDTEHPEDGIDEKVIRFAQKADILIHDAHFTPGDLPAHRNWGHSSWEKAVDVAKRANVNSLYLFHFCPEYDDEKMEEIEREAKQHFPNLVAAREGLTIKIPTE